MLGCLQLELTDARSLDWPESTDMTPASFLSAVGKDLVEMSERTKGKTI